MMDQPEMSVPLSSAYGALLGEADALSEKIETFGLLFGMGDERVDLLVRTAGNVTWILYEALWDSILLGMNRLLDRAETATASRGFVRVMCPHMKRF